MALRMWFVLRMSSGLGLQQPRRRAQRLELPLSFALEPHLFLDLLGDLTLVGAPLRAHVISVKGGHTSNVGLARKLRAELL